MTHKLEVELLANTVLSTSRNAYVAETLDYIPGSTLRGALAAKYLAAHDGKVDTTFKRLFLSGDIVFPNLYLKAGGDRLTRPFPKTFLKCKLHEAPFAVRGDGSRHFIDTSGYLLSTALGGQPREITCPACGERLEGFSGYCYLDNEGNWADVQVSKYGRTGTQINYLNGAVSQGNLFYLEGLAEDQTFAGLAHLRDDQLSESLRDLADGNGAGSLLLGRAVTRGRGISNFACHRLAGRAGEVVDMNIRFSKFQDLAAKPGKRPRIAQRPKFFFSLTLLSDCINRTVTGYGSKLNSGDLGIDGKHKVTVLSQAAQATRVAGWNNLWGLPKSEELAIEKGSVFIYGSDTDDVAGLIAELETLETVGVGVRRIDGFGEVAVCDQFHLDNGADIDE